MNSEKLQSLRIPTEAKRRSQKAIWFIFVGVLFALVVAVVLAWPRESDKVRTMGKAPPPVRKDKAAAAATTTRPPASTGANATEPRTSPAPDEKAAGSILTVSGYIINRERIELSPRFMGVVKWIGVKKGDYVTNGQTVVLLDDAEYRARLAETKGRRASAEVALQKAQISFERVSRLAQERVESQQLLDDARLAVDAAKALLLEIDGHIEGIQNYLDWTVIKSPISGVVLEKLVDPNELVTPQSFGGTRGPSTALIALADTKDLQVEIDLNEADVAKVFLNQKCKVSPEAYPDKAYDGFVAEKAPEANRQKGTLQVKVQILNPDEFLTPELSAKVDFLKATRD